MLRSPYLSDVDGCLLGADTVVEVTGVSLSLGAVNFGAERSDTGISNVGIVGGLQSTLILGADGREDSVGSGDGRSLGGLVLGSREGTRVEKDEGILLGGNSSEVSSSDGGLQVNNADSVGETGTLDGGLRDGTISRGHLRKSDNSSGADGSHGGTAIHVQGSAGTLGGGRSESGSRGDKKGGDNSGELHGGCIIDKELRL
mmetsp:Transcript_16981/g.41384  ORF Transcript_16981/g.41384 Transcript_16981/m.41384 type:complete len:201 (-) Transcript_16981:13-615(-)